MEQQAVERIVQLGSSHPQGFTADILQKNVTGIPVEALNAALNQLLSKRIVVALQIGTSTVYKVQSKEQIAKFAGLSNPDIIVYHLIESAQASGIFLKDIKTKTGNAQSEKSVNKLISRGIVKRVEGIRQKCYILSELTPSEGLTGNRLHAGDIDLADLQDTILEFVRKKGVVTLKQIENLYSNSQLSTKHYEQVLSSLILDGEVEQVRSTGVEEFKSIPANTVCYKARPKSLEYVSAFTSIPCGVCPVLRECTPGGLISPSTCVYYTEWLRW